MVNYTSSQQRHVIIKPGLVGLINQDYNKIKQFREDAKYEKSQVLSKITIVIAWAFKSHKYGSKESAFSCCNVYFKTSC
jgi:hypothetical protein